MMSKPHFQAEASAIQKDGDNYIIKPRGLNIVWGNVERYWKLPAKESEGEDGAAELKESPWLEVTGSVDLTAKKKYKLTFDTELLPDAFGWKQVQVCVMTKLGEKGKCNWKKVQLMQPPEKGEMIEKDTIPQPEDTLFIVVPESQTDTTLQFGLYEVWSGKWKGGLKIYNAKVTVVT